MKIWVDADACPVLIKDVLYRVADRTGVELTLVANQFLQVPRIASVSFLQVSSGFDAADDEIVARSEKGDLVITSDTAVATDEELNCATRKGRALAPTGTGSHRQSRPP